MHRCTSALTAKYLVVGRKLIYVRWPAIFVRLMTCTVAKKHCRNSRANGIITKLVGRCTGRRGGGQRGPPGDHFSLGYRSIPRCRNCRREKMGFMISFDGPGTLTSDERCSARYRANGSTIDDRCPERRLLTSKALCLQRICLLPFNDSSFI